MKPLAALTMVRVIRVTLNITWYGSMIMILPVVILISTGDGVKSWYLVKVQLDSTKTIGEMHLKTTGQSVEFGFHDQKGRTLDRSSLWIRVTPPTSGWAFGWNAFAFVGIAMALAELYLLRKIFLSIKNASPFTRANARRVRAIGLLIVGAEILYCFFIPIMQGNLSRIVDTKGFYIVTGFRIDYDAIFFGLIVIALSELFRYGVELEEEKALTV